MQEKDADFLGAGLAGEGICKRGRTTDEIGCSARMLSFECLSLEDLEGRSDEDEDEDE